MRKGIIHARLALALSVLFLLSGCSTLLKWRLDDAVNNQFPPVSYADAKKSAVDRSNQELLRVQNPRLLLNVPASAITQAFDAEIRKVQMDGIKVLHAEIVPDEQGLKFITDIEGTIKGPDGRFRARLQGWAMVSLANNVASVQPLLKTAKLTHLKLDRWHLSTKPAVAAINAVLRRYINNVNGQIKALTYQIDPADIGLSGVPTPIQVGEGQTVVLPGATLTAAAVLIDAKGLHLLADIEVRTEAANLAAALDSYPAYRDAFWAKGEKVRQGTGRTDPGLFIADSLLSDLLKPVFPPVTMDLLQQQALANLKETLKTKGTVAAGAVIKPEEVVNRIGSLLKNGLKDSPQLQYGQPIVTLAEQSILVHLPVAGVMEAAHLKFRGSITIGGVLATSGKGLYYRAAIDGLQLDSVEHTGGIIGAAEFVVSVNQLLFQLIPYANSLLKEELVDLGLPDIKTIPLKQDGVDIKPDVFTIPEHGPIVVVPRVSAQGIKVLVYEADGAPVPLTANLSVGAVEEVALKLSATASAEKKAFLKSLARTPPVDPAEVDALFDSYWNGALPPATPIGDTDTKISTVVSVPWVFATVNEALAANAVSVSMNLDSGSLPFDSGKLSLLGKFEVKCPTITCKRDSCPLDSCSRSSCDRDCKWHDVGCKVSEAACNVKEELQLGVCKVAANTKKAACDVAEETKMAACVVARETARLHCNLANEIIDAIKDIDDVGRFTGAARAQGSAAIANPAIRYDSTTSTVSLEMTPSADIRLTGDLNYHPEDIGHLLICPIPGQAPFAISGRLAMGRTTINAHLSNSSTSAGGDELNLAVRFDPVLVKGNLSPAPLDALLAQNPQIFVLCSPVLTSITGTISVVGKVSAFGPVDVIKALERAIPGNQDSAANAMRVLTQGKIEQAVTIPPMNVVAPVLRTELAGEVLELKPEWRDGHLFYINK